MVFKQMVVGCFLVAGMFLPSYAVPSSSTKNDAEPASVTVEDICTDCYNPTWSSECMCCGPTSTVCMPLNDPDTGCNRCGVCNGETWSRW